MSRAQPAFATALWAGVRFEARQLFGSWVPWFLLVAFPAGAWLLGAVRGSEATVGGWFSNVSLAMALTVVPVVFAHQLAAAGLSGSNRELTRARAADEFVQALSRVAVVGTYGAVLMFFVSVTIAGHISLLTPLPIVLPWLMVIWLVGLLCAVVGSLAASVSLRLPMLGLPLALLLWVLWPWVAAPLFGPAFLDPFLRVLGWSPMFAAGPAEALWPVLVSGGGLLVLMGLVVLSVVPTVIERGRIGTLVRSRSLMGVVVATLLVLGVMFAVTERRRLIREQVLVDGAALKQVEVAEWLPDHRRLVVTGSSGTTVIEGPARPTAVAEDAVLTVGRYVPVDAWFVPYVGRNGVAVPVARLQPGGPYEFELVLPAGWTAHGCAAFTSARHCVGEDAASDWLLITRAGTVEGWDANVAAQAPGIAAGQTVYRENVTALLHATGHRDAEFIPVGLVQPFWFASASVAMPPGFGEEAVRVRMAHYRAAYAASYAVVRGWEDQGEPSYLQLGEPPLWLLAVVDRAAFALGVTPYDPTEAQRRSGVMVTGARLHPFLPGPSDTDNRQEFDRWWIATGELLDGNEALAKELLLRLAESGGWADPDTTILETLAGNQ